MAKGKTPVSAGKPRAGRAAARQASEAAILRAAEQVFAEQGYHGATMALIAERAGLPKANLHYYFGTKQRLYRRLLESILELWLSATAGFAAESDPAEALAGYIAEKIEYSRTRPLASRIFANEVIAGAPHISGYLRTTLKQVVEEKSRAVRSWIASGRMDPLDPTHLFVTLWAMTQTYADFAVQVAALKGKDRLDGEDYDAARAFITQAVLKGCGLRPPDVNTAGASSQAVVSEARER